MFDIRIWHDFVSMQKRIFVSRKTAKSREFLIKGKWEKREPHIQHTDNDFFKADEPEFDSFMQALVDEAWKAGYRPKEYVGVGNELAATKAHLEDMRKIKGELFERFITTIITGKEG